MRTPDNTAAAKKSGIHPRSRHTDRYDFPALISLYPDLSQFVFTNKHGKETIDFANPRAVRTLNSVLLQHHYGIRFWEIPEDHLCPPIPGRADYIHHLADLLAGKNGGAIPAGPAVSVLDIGVGANTIYPLIGNSEYGWRFVGSDTDPGAVSSAQRIMERNGIPIERIEVRLQPEPDQFFRSIIHPDERFDLSMCNPPFHSSMDQADAGTRRKWKNLGVKKQNESTVLNFGGKHHELVYPGGEIAFIKGMANESAAFGNQVLWFTTLISKGSNLIPFTKELERLNAVQVRIIEMAQGQKRSRIAAWTFLTENDHAAWTQRR